MNRLEIHNKVHYVLALFIAFTLPFGKLIPIGIILLLLNWLIEGDFKIKVQSIYKNKLALIFISLYLLHVVGLLFTTNTNAGLFDLQVKLSILIFPLIIASKPYTKEQIRHIFIAFILGLLYSSLYMLSRAISLYFIDEDNNFFYGQFAVFLHTSYYSMYLNLAIVWILLNSIKKSSHWFSPFHSILLVLFFSVIIVLLSSKSGIIGLGLILLTTIGYIVFLKKKYLLGVIGTIILVIGLLSMNYFAPNTIHKLTNIVTAVTTESNTETTESSSVRLLVWESSNQVIKENLLFGVGTGDSKEALIKEYSKRNIKTAVENKLNAHNEFYQIFICLGLLGFIILLINLIYPFVFAVQTKHYLYCFFILIIGFNFLSESMLETQAGVIFYAFFNSILCFVAVVDSKTSKIK